MSKTPVQRQIEREINEALRSSRGKRKEPLAGRSSLNVQRGIKHLRNLSFGPGQPRNPNLPDKGLADLEAVENGLDEVVFLRRPRVTAPVYARKKTTIEIYPSCHKPPWLVVGAEVEVLGEGRGCRFRITAVEGSRAAVVPKSQYRKGHKGGCWESFTKIYRPDHFDEDYAFSREGR